MLPERTYWTPSISPMLRKLLEVLRNAMEERRETTKKSATLDRDPIVSSARTIAEKFEASVA
jgi:hypothetical protein